MKSRRLLFFLCVFFLLNANAFSQSTDLVPFLDANGKWGYKNGNGEIVIEPNFELAGSFSEGIAVIGVYKVYKIYETNGDVVKIEGIKFGMIDSKGKVVIEPKYNNSYIAYHNGYFILDHEIIDKKGNRITAKNGDFEGRSYFDHISLLEESDLAIVDPYGIGKGRYLMRLDGQIIGKYDYGFYDFKEGLCLIANRHGKKEYVESDLCWISLYGYIDTSGKVVIKPKFRDARSFSEGLAVAKNNKYKRGYIDKKGKWAIKPQYFYAGDFKNGLAFVCGNGFVGFINKKGEAVYDYTKTKEDPWLSFIKGIDESADYHSFVGPVSAYWMNDGKGCIEYWTDYTRKGIKTRTKTVIVDEKGNALYFVGNKGEKVDKDGKPIENQENQNPCIDWPDIPSSTNQQLFALNAQIKSDSKIAYCTVYLNGSPIAEDFAPGGSHVANDIKETDNYNFTISKTLALIYGKNTVRIKVGNAGGVTDESREITYTPIKQPVAKPAIAWGDIPERTTSSKLVVTAEVTSKSAIAGCDLYLEKNCDGTKGSHIAPDIIEGQEKGMFSKSMSQTFTLCEGENNIVAEATNAAGTTKVEKKVTYEKPEPPTIAWDGIAPENTTKATLEVMATVASKTDVTWRIMKSSSGKTKGSDVAADIIENVVASGKGNNVNGKVTLSPGYNTITIEATNAYERKTVSKKVWYSPCEKRIALVIGNKNYKGRNKGGFDPLNKTLNDADTIAKLLKNECGFDVIKVENANHRVMEDTINEFINRVKYNGYKTAFVYYSGHGASYDRQEGDNYLIPIDCADCTDSIKARGIEVRTRILQRLEKEIGGSCPVKIAMLDCCRTYRVTHCSPLPGANGGTRGSYDMVGLSEMKLPEGVAVLYGAEFDHPSYDGIGANSPFVECFVKYVREHPKSNWRDLGFEVRKMVNEMTKDYVNPYTQKPDPQKPYPDIFKFSNADKFYLNPYHDKP